MQPLIDGDVLRYEIGFAAEVGWRKRHPESTDPPPFYYVDEILEERINAICNDVEATEPPLIYLTGKDNFRIEVANKKIYKGTRKKEHKPWHYNNLTAHLITQYRAITVDGMEADDAMCIEQTARLDKLDTIICTRDKDLRQCKGWHYGWELGKQPQFGPLLVDGLGSLKLEKKTSWSLKGTGDKFLFAQMLIGDQVDNIPGLPGIGPVKAYELLSICETYADMEETVVEAYKAVYEDSWRCELEEQAMLVYMIRELDNNKPVMFKLRGEYA